MYIIVSIVAFFILGIIWSKSDFTNFSIKIGFFAMAGWGLVVSDAVRINL